MYVVYACDNKHELYKVYIITQEACMKLLKAYIYNLYNKLMPLQAYSHLWKLFMI